MHYAIFHFKRIHGHQTVVTHLVAANLATARDNRHFASNEFGVPRLDLGPRFAADVDVGSLGKRDS